MLVSCINFSTTESFIFIFNAVSILVFVSKINSVEEELATTTDFSSSIIIFYLSALYYDKAHNHFKFSYFEFNSFIGIQIELLLNQLTTDLVLKEYLN